MVGISLGNKEEGKTVWIPDLQHFPCLDDWGGSSIYAAP